MAYKIIPGDNGYVSGVASSNDTILFDGSSSDLPDGKYGDFAYCISGTDKGKAFFWDGTQWVEQ